MDPKEIIELIKENDLVNAEKAVFENLSNRAVEALDLVKVYVAEGVMDKKKDGNYKLKMTNSQGETFHTGSISGMKAARDKHYSLSKSGKWKKIEIVKEEDQEINELSKKTLGSYIKKAHSSVPGIDTNIRSYEFVKKHFKDRDSHNYYNSKISQLEKKKNNREVGINKATDKLTKEDQEINELSNKVLASYIGKAADDYPKQNKKYNSAIRDYVNKKISKKDLHSAVKKKYNRKDGIEQAYGKIKAKMDNSED